MIYPEIKEETIEGKTVIRVDFSGLEKPYSSNGRYYKRIFNWIEEITPDELKQMMDSTDHTSYWENNVTKYGLEKWIMMRWISFIRRLYHANDWMFFVEDSMLNLISKGFSYIKEHINWSVRTGEGTSRIEIPEIPVEAVREIVVNSFAYADYRALVKK